jgi:hypothetical protein
MFILRRLIVPIVFLVALFLGASVVLENFAESQLAGGAERALGLQTRPKVDIDAFPIIWRVIQGSIPEVRVEAKNFVIEHLEVSELVVDMRGVRADLGVLIRSDQFDLNVDDGEATARITEDATNAFLVHEKVDAHVTFLANGKVFVRADRVVGGRTRRFEATGMMTLGGRKLSFKPETVKVEGRSSASATLLARARRDTTFSVEIPKLPGNLLPSEVVVTKGEVALVASLRGYSLKLSK